MALPFVSIVLAVYDTRPFVREAVSSALAQEYEALEVVAVDDGSTDGSLEELRSFEGRPRFRLLAETHCGLGPPGTRNTGVRAASGDYVLFLDGDDTIAPELVARLAALVDPAEPKAYAYCDYVKVDLDGRPLAVNDYSIPRVRHRLEGNLLAPLLLGNYVQPNGVLFSRRFLLDLGGLDTRYPGCDDFDLWLRAACDGATARFCPSPMARYRQRPGSLITNRPAQESMTARIREAAVAAHPAAVAAAVPDLVLEAQQITARLWREGRSSLEEARAYAATLERSNDSAHESARTTATEKDAALAEARAYAAGLEEALRETERSARAMLSDKDAALGAARAYAATLEEAVRAADDSCRRMVEAKDAALGNAEAYAASLLAARDSAIESARRTEAARATAEGYARSLEAALARKEEESALAAQHLAAMKNTLEEAVAKRKRRWWR
jgi:hypothetical protein